MSSTTNNNETLTIRLNRDRFNYFVNRTYTLIKDHQTINDATSARLAAFSAGKTVGFFIAIGQPDDMRDDIEKLQEEFFNKVGPA